jgi:type I pantothenate kinase
MDIRTTEQQYNPYRIFTREQWARLRDDTPMTLEPGEFERLRSMHDRLDMLEVEDIYLPLSRLLSIYVDATHRLYQAQRQFLDIRDRKVPYIIGVAGSVAVGKSTTARVLQALLARWSPRPKVDLVTTDGFLFPNAVLERQGLMQKKGFPFPRAMICRCCCHSSPTSRPAAGRYGRRFTHIWSTTSCRMRGSRSIARTS